MDSLLRALLAAMGLSFCAVVWGQAVVEGSGVEDLGACLLVADLDGDGRAEVVAGAPRHTAASRHHQGRVLVLRGTTGEPGSQATTWLGPQAGSRFGSSLAVGDLDGDGAPEVAVGSPAAAGGRGAVHLFRGGRGGGEILGGGDLSTAEVFLLLQGASELGGFGSALALGDLDGDGRSELVVAEPGATVGTTPRAGRVLVFRGRKSWKGPKAVSGEGDYAPGLVLVGREEEGLGSRLLVADLTGDGLGDLVALSPFTRHAGHPEAGSAVVVLGRPGLLQGQQLVLDRDAPDHLIMGKGGGRLGEAACALDLDGDGTQELVLAEPRRDHGSARQAGALHALKLGEAPALLDLGRSREARIATLYGSVANEAFGTTLLAPPRRNGEGADLLVGSPAVGRVVLFRKIGAFDPPPSPAQALMPSGSGARGFGASMGIGDLNGDGEPEIVIGAPGSNRLYIY